MIKTVKSMAKKSIKEHKRYYRFIHSSSHGYELEHFKDIYIYIYIYIYRHYRSSTIKIIKQVGIYMSLQSMLILRNPEAMVKMSTSS